jgi:hypothetical protein
VIKEAEEVEMSNAASRPASDNATSNISKSCMSTEDNDQRLRIGQLFAVPIWRNCQFNVDQWYKLRIEGGN